MVGKEIPKEVVNRCLEERKHEKSTGNTHPSFEPGQRWEILDEGKRKADGAGRANTFPKN